MPTTPRPGITYTNVINTSWDIPVTVPLVYYTPEDFDKEVDKMMTAHVDLLPSDELDRAWIRTELRLHIAIGKDVSNLSTLLQLIEKEKRRVL